MSTDSPRERLLAELVDRFLSWPLPNSVCADLCATKRDYGYRSGTNLLTADEALEMFKHVVAPKIDALQAKIDALMLEYCPDEMTPAQLKEWGDNQRAAQSETGDTDTREGRGSSLAGVLADGSPHSSTDAKPGDAAPGGAGLQLDDKRETPRTEAFWTEKLGGPAISARHRTNSEWLSFARQLEREVEQLQRHIATLVTQIHSERELNAARSATGATEEQEVLSKLAVDSGYERWWIRDGELFLERDSRDKPGFITVLHIDHLGSAFRPDR